MIKNILLTFFILWRAVLTTNGFVWTPVATREALIDCQIQAEEWKKEEQKKHPGSAVHIVCLPDTIQPPFEPSTK